MKFEYNHRNKFIINMIINFIVLLVPILVFLTCFMIIGRPVLNIAILVLIAAFQMFISVLMIPFIIDSFKMNLPFLKISFLITEEQFQIAFFGHTYVKYFWNEIKQIELSDEDFQEDWVHFKKKDKLKILKNDNSIEEIRLHLLGIKKQLLKEIIHEFKIQSQKSNIPFIEIKGFERGDSEQRRLEFTKIINFINEVKSK